MSDKNENRISKSGRSALYEYTEQVYEAFKTDVETFLTKFEKEKSFNYTHFATVWHLTHFSFIFANQSQKKLLEILCEVCFITVKKYIMYHSSLYIQLGAFYLLYGLYYKQPLKDLVKIRLTLEEYQMIKRLMNLMCKKGQYDALYIFAKLKSDEAFSYVAHPIQLRIPPKPNLTKVGVNDIYNSRTSLSSLFKFEHLLNDEAFSALDKTCKEYESKLLEFTKKDPGLVPQKSMVIKSIGEVHKNSGMKVSGFQSKSTKASESPEKEPRSERESSNVYSTRQSVRLKALQNKNAVYRGSKKVLTALDLEDSSSDSD